MGGGGGYSSSVQSSSTTSYVDSFNQTYDQVLNLTDVGNVKLGWPDSSQSSLSTIATLGLVVVAAAVGFFALRR